MKASEDTKVVGVKRLSQYLKRILESDKNLRGIGVTGEISNLKPHPLGLFFSLKEEDALLNCVAWSDVAGTLPALRDGLEITAYGSLALWPKRGGYQLIVRRVQTGELGDFHVRYEELRKRLAEEGLFDRPKRALPRYPFGVALVSSSCADGYNDFVKIMRARAPHVRITLLETPVQGLSAVSGIVDALARASRLDVDVIVMARGGGSPEDIFAFSQEQVVRAVAQAAHPVISAIGHAKDVPLCDLSADRRAETPSNAAHLLTECTTTSLSEMIGQRGYRLKLGVRRALLIARRRVDTAVERSALLFPERVLQSHRRRLVDVGERLERVDPGRRSAGHRAALTLLAYRLMALTPLLLERKRTRCLLLAQALTAADPMAILKRGYALVEHNGHIVRKPEDVDVGALVVARLGRGKLIARVEGQEYG
jgi:exodeoxyribonuclease VII large subunit